MSAHGKKEKATGKTRVGYLLMPMEQPPIFRLYTGQQGAALITRDFFACLFS